MIYNISIMKQRTGFTIAELLISLLIVSIVGTAMVPIVWPKKMKVPSLRTVHGVYECYWGDDGSLHYFTQNNTNLKDGQEGAIAGDSCSFTPPKASFFEVYVVGAGGNGGGNQNNVYYNLRKGRPYTGTIPTASGFYSAVSHLPDAIRNLMDSNSLEARYVIKSAGGGPGGRGCDGTRCNWDNIARACSRSWWYYDWYYCNGGNMIPGDIIEANCETAHYNDGKGGAGIEATASIVLKSNAMVQPGYGSLYVNSNGRVIDIVTTTGQGGTSAVCCRPDSELPCQSKDGDDGEDGRCVKTVGATSCKQGSNKKDGSYVIGSPFTYTIETADIDYVFGQHGQAGSVVSKIFSQFKTPTLRLAPARTNNNGTSFSQLFAVDTNGTARLLLQAKSGANGDLMARTYTGIGSDAADAFRWEDRLLVLSIPDIQGNISGNDAFNLRTGMSNLNPGMPGSGAYSMVHNRNFDTSTSISDGVHTYSTDTSISITGRNTCYPEAIDTPNVSYNSRQQPFCRAGQGKGGAVIISW